MLRTEILVHPFLRSTHCCLCGSPWEEQYISVPLLTGARSVGTLCPRCLQRAPCDAAAALDRSVTQLRTLSEELALLRQSVPCEPDDLPARTARLAEETARLHVVTRRLMLMTAHLRG